jgi:hypothetical protein
VVIAAAEPRPQVILPPQLKVGENGPEMGWSHDTQNSGCFDTIIYVKLNLLFDYE